MARASDAQPEAALTAEEKAVLRLLRAWVDHGLRPTGPDALVPTLRRGAAVTAAGAAK